VSRVSRPPSQPFISKGWGSGLSLKPSTDRIGSKAKPKRRLVQLEFLEALLARQISLLGHAGPMPSWASRTFRRRLLLGRKPGRRISGTHLSFLRQYPLSAWESQTLWQGLYPESFLNCTRYVCLTCETTKVHRIFE
jgi:hypothetical protein